MAYPCLPLSLLVRFVTPWLTGLHSVPQFRSLDCWLRSPVVVRRRPYSSLRLPPSRWSRSRCVHPSRGRTRIYCLLNLIEEGTGGDISPKWLTNDPGPWEDSWSNFELRVLMRHFIHENGGLYKTYSRLSSDLFKSINGCQCFVRVRVVKLNYRGWWDVSQDVIVPGNRGWLYFTPSSELRVILRGVGFTWCDLI